MPLQNRVAPDGAIVSTRARGTIMGNRGILHDENQRLVRTSRNRMWLICLLEFKGRQRRVMSPGTYTELFFLDEAVALAAGHRPCGECRRTRYRAYLDAVNIGNAQDLDRTLNAARKARRATAPINMLPDGVFITLGDDDFRLIWKGAAHRWSAEGYTDPVPTAALGGEPVTLLTPTLSVTALGNGYAVQVHPSAG